MSRKGSQGPSKRALLRAEPCSPPGQLSRKAKQRGASAAEIHGDRKQSERDAALQDAVLARAQVNQRAQPGQQNAKRRKTTGRAADPEDGLTYAINITEDVLEDLRVRRKLLRTGGAIAAMVKAVKGEAGPEFIATGLQ